MRGGQRAREGRGGGEASGAGEDRIHEMAQESHLAERGRRRGDRLVPRGQSRGPASGDAAVVRRRAELQALIRDCPRGVPREGPRRRQG